MNDKVATIILGVGVLAMAVVLAVKEPAVIEVSGQDGKVQVVERSVGAGSPDHYSPNRFFENISKGGSYATTSSASSYTLTTNELAADRGDAYISWLPNNSVTLTTMASSSEPFASLEPGESYEVLFYNASTTAAATVTFAAGTGVDLQEDEGETVVVNGLEVARLTFVKKADTDVIAWVEVGQVGD